jgi:hypothetical protein
MTKSKRGKGSHPSSPFSPFSFKLHGGLKSALDA